jgi:hypothetical protein
MKEIADHFNIFAGILNLNLFLRPVAQLAEHVTLNHGVEGSIPSGPTNETYFL